MALVMYRILLITQYNFHFMQASNEEIVFVYTIYLNQNEKFSCRKKGHKSLTFVFSLILSNLLSLKYSFFKSYIMCIKKVSSINLKSKTKGWFLLVWVFLSDKSINYLKLLKALYSCLESVNCLVYCSHTSMFGAYINHVTKLFSQLL